MFASNIRSSSNATLSRVWKSQQASATAAAAAVANMSASAPGVNNRIMSSVVSKPVPDAQSTRWNSYLASGRGSKALFASINKDHNGKLSVSDIRNLLNAVDQFELAGVNRKAFGVLDDKAEDHALTLQEFQEWLVLATQDCEQTKCIHPQYQQSKEVGQTSAPKPEGHDHAWNCKYDESIPASHAVRYPW